MTHAGEWMSSGDLSAAAKAFQDPAVKDKLEQEAGKVLKKLGFPPLETVNGHGASLPKVLACLTRRLTKLDETMTELQQLQKSKVKTKPNGEEENLSSKTITKIQGFIHACHAGHNCVLTLL